MRKDKYRNGTQDGAYMRVCLRKEGEKGSKNFKIHRLVAYAFVENDNPEENDIVNHLNNIGTDNFYKNLEWCTNADNIHHAYTNFFHKMETRKGIANPSNLYSESLIMRICELLTPDKYKYTALQIQDIIRHEFSGTEFVGNIEDMVYKIRSKSLWSHISNQYF